MRNPLLGVSAVLVILCAVPASAQVNSVETTATLTAVLPESLTVALVPGAVSFALTGGSATNAGNTSITATTTWTLRRHADGARVVRLLHQRLGRPCTHGGDQHG